MQPDDSIRKRAKRIVDAGDVPKATLQESITLNEKIDVLIDEVKKKDLLEYDIQIDEDARLHLKGDKGDTGEKGEKGDKGDVGPQGKQGETGKQGPKGDKGKDGKDGVDGIDGRDGKDGKDAVLGDIKISDVKELPETIATLQNRTQLLNQMVSRVDNSSSTTVSGVAETFETVSANLPASNATLNYNGNGDITSIVYSSGITKTFNYTGADITSIVLSGSTPSGISLTKTLSYTDGDVTGIEYT